MFSCQYTNTGLISIANKLFGEKILSEAKEYLAINTVRLWNGSSSSWEPATFSNATGNAYANVKMKDAALATAAAPTYFPSYQIGNLGYFADGGTYANNPSLSAITDILKSKCADTLCNVRILSIGTGLAPQRIPASSTYDPLSLGVNYWMWSYTSNHVAPTALMNLMMDCTSQTVTVEAQNMLLNNFCRGNVPMPESVGLDEWKKCSLLERFATAYMNRLNGSKCVAGLMQTGNSGLCCKK